MRLEVERERLGLWIPVGLGLGIAAWFGLPDALAWGGWIASGCVLAGLALLLPDGSRARALLAGAGLLVAAGCALVWGRALLVGAPPLPRPVFTQLEGEVLQVERQPALGRWRLVIAPAQGGANGMPRRIRVTLPDADRPAGVGEGARLRFRIRLMPPPAAALPGSYDYARVAYFAGIGATGRALPPVRLVGPARGEGTMEAWRRRLVDHVRTRLPGPEGAIAATLATGDRGGISARDADAIRRSGLAHLLSISGLHVSALIGAVMALVYRLLALSRRLALGLPLMQIAAGAGALAGLGYTLLTGAQVPTVRACAAALLVLGGLVLGREPISLRLIAAGSLVVLLLWPESLLGPSFQMSFAAVIVIVALMETGWFRALTQPGEADRAGPGGAIRRFARAATGLFVTGLAVEAALMPIALYHFHQAGVLGALANLVAIPLTTFVIMPAEALALILDGVGAGGPFWWVTGRGLALLLGLAHHVGGQSFAIWLAPTFGAVPFAALLLGGLWLLLWRTDWRLWGLLPVAGAVAALLLASPPDLLVSGDGHHMAIRQADGRLALLRPRAGAYMRATLSGAAGLERDEADDGRSGIGGGGLGALAEAPNARCSADLCAVRLRGARRDWMVLATRSDVRLPLAPLVAACAGADIVVADRRLPRGCRPRWLLLDAGWLRDHGGVLVWLRGRPHWRSLHGPADAHPWIAGRRPPAWLPGGGVAWRADVRTHAVSARPAL